MSEQRGFFDLDARYAALSAAGDPLEKLSGLIDFERFRSGLDGALKRSDGRKGGRPPLDAVRSMRSLPGSTRISNRWGIWRWEDRSWTRAS